MSPKQVLPAKPGTGDFHPQLIAAWLLCAVFYFVQYALRSAPGVMVPELSTAWGLNALGLSSLLGMYYYTYAIFAIVAGATLDRWGAKWTIPAGIACLAVGTVLFAWGTVTEAQIGRLLQGAGSAFSFVGAVYLAARGFPARYLATALGATQMFGMLGGSAGQFAVSPMIHSILSWQDFWLYSGAVVAVLAVITFFATPSEDVPASHRQGSLLQMFTPYKEVLSNPQSYLCGFCAGLLFLPTTIGDMIWGVPILQLGFGVEYAEAVNRAAMIPLGWVFGSPILGYVADRMGRRKPVLIVSAFAMLGLAVAILYLPAGTLPHYIGGFLFGFASGAAMIPYSIIKEVNPDRIKGSATGAMNFLVFTLSAVAAPIAGFVLQKIAGKEPLNLHDFHEWGFLGLGAIALGIILAFFLKETGSAVLKVPAIVVHKSSHLKVQTV
ncbi:MAG: MFS transporter [Chlorobium sp.]|nr:MFS transporter [Chlorobium sp.]